MLRKILTASIIALVSVSTTIFAQTEDAVTVSVTTNREGAERLHDFLVRNGYSMPSLRTYSRPVASAASPVFDAMSVLQILFWIILAIAVVWIGLKIIRRIIRVIEEHREDVSFTNNITYLKTNPIDAPHKGLNLADRLGSRYYA